MCLWSCCAWLWSMTIRCSDNNSVNMFELIVSFYSIQCSNIKDLSSLELLFGWRTFSVHLCRLKENWRVELHDIIGLENEPRWKKIVDKVIWSSPCCTSCPQVAEMCQSSESVGQFQVYLEIVSCVYFQTTLIYRNDLIQENEAELRLTAVHTHLNLHNGSVKPIDFFFTGFNTLLLGVLAPQPSNRTPSLFMSATGPERRTLHFRAQSPTDWAATTSPLEVVTGIIMLSPYSYRAQSFCISSLFILLPSKLDVKLITRRNTASGFGSILPLHCSHYTSTSTQSAWLIHGLNFGHLT